MHNILIPAIFVLLSSATAFAQNALGDGSALDGSTSSLGRVNQKRLLPTGVLNNEINRSNVLKGRGLNEGIGRSASDSVGLQLLADAANDGSSDSTFRDNLYNTPWYWNNWYKQSAQFLSGGDIDYFNPSFIDNWSTAPEQMSNGRMIRSYAHAWNPEDARKYGGTGELEYPDEWSKRQVDQYKLGQVLGSGSQPNPMDSSPVPVGSHVTRDSIGYLAASPMTGVSLETSDMPTTALGFSAWDAARVTQDSENGVGSSRLVQPWRTAENRLEQSDVNTQIDVSNQYNNVLQTVEGLAKDKTASMTSEEEQSLQWLETQYLMLQNELAGIPYSGEVGDDGEIVDPFGIEPTEQEQLSEEAIEILAGALRHGEQITQFSGQSNTRFDELVQLGEDELSKGNYFDAQRRFNQALQFVPGHPLATAGLGHAKIGAGLYLSAGYVLQSLLSFQPEMIDVEYDSSLLPPRIELVRAAVTISNRLDIERDAGTYAFLLAYLGHQIHDREMVEQGLDTFQLHTDADDPIVPLLRSIWLEDAFMNKDEALQTE